MGYCPDCGCKMYNGACVNCHEEVYIRDQYEELGMPMSKEFEKKVEEKEREVVKNQMNWRLNPDY